MHGPSGPKRQAVAEHFAGRFIPRGGALLLALLRRFRIGIGHDHAVVLEDLLPRIARLQLGDIIAPALPLQFDGTRLETAEDLPDFLL